MFMNNKIWGSHGGEYEDGCLLGCSAILITLMMEAARSSEMLVNFYQTTRHYNPEDSHLCLWIDNYKPYLSGTSLKKIKWVQFKIIQMLGNTALSTSKQYLISCQIKFGTLMSMVYIAAAILSVSSIIIQQPRRQPSSRTSNPTYNTQISKVISCLS
jgi:hypothetical protein